MTIKIYFQFFFLLFFPVCLTGQAYRILDKSNFELDYIQLNQLSDPGPYYTDFILDNEGYLWLSGRTGLSVFDGKSTITYTSQDDGFTLTHDSINHDFKVLTKDGNNQIFTNARGVNAIMKVNTEKRSAQFLKYPYLPQERSIQKLFYHKEFEALYFCVVNTDNYIYGIHKFSEISGLEKIFEWKLEGNSYREYVDFEFINEKFYLLADDLFYVISMEGEILHQSSLKMNKGYLDNLYSNNEKLFYYSETVHVMYQWNDESLEFFPTGMLNGPLKDFSGRFFFLDHLVIAGNYDQLYVINSRNKTISDLSGDFVDLKKEFAPSFISNEPISAIQEVNGQYLLLTANLVFRINEEIYDINDYQIPISGLDQQPSCREIIKDNTGRLMVNYYSGIAIKEDKENLWKPLKINYPTGKQMTTAYSLAQWENKYIWNTMLIDESQNAYHLNDQVPFYHSENIILEDTLWFHRWYFDKWYRYEFKSEKLQEFDFDTLSKPNSNIEMINKIIEDPNSNKFWIATMYNGISLIERNGKCVKNYLPPLVQKEEYLGVYDMLTIDSLLWFTYDQGIGHINLNTDSISTFKYKNISDFNLPTNTKFYSMMLMEDQHLLLGSEKGLYRFNLRNYEFKKLVKNHPLSKIEFNRNSTFKDKDIIYMGSTNGLFQFDYIDLPWKKDEVKLQPKFLRVSSFGKDNKTSYYNIPVDDSNPIRIKPGEKNISIHFSFPGLNKKTFYSYRIPKLDPTWTSYSTENQFNIYALPPGKHEVEIKATDNLNYNLLNPQKLVIYQSQHWYKTTTAIIAYFICVLGVISGIFWYRFTQIKRYENLRTKISSDLHDDVGTLLTSVAMQSDLLSINVTKEEEKRLANLSELSRKALSNMRDTVWAIDSRKDNFVSLIDKMQDFLSEMPEEKFKVTFNHSGSNLTHQLAPDIRQNIYLIFKEAITNAYKHSNGDELLISFHHSRYATELLIKDNGKTDPTKFHKSGNGILNMHMRATRIQGELIIDTKDGFSLFFKL